MARVFAAMSGGVDSSVAAALLVDAGNDVTGVTMQLLPQGDGPGQCCGTSAVRDAKRTCDLLGITHFTLNVRRQFAAEVIEPFCDAYAAGETPNPCIVCNDRIKFVELWRRAAQQGAEYLATGHYAGVERDSNGEPWLVRGLDRAKDQSYFLYRLTREQLERTLFPVGALTKTDVRRTASEFGLPTATMPESQDVCFIAGDTGDWVASKRPEAGASGPIVDAAGRELGQHRGLAAYTVGQRHGLGLPGGPHYVLALRAAANEVVVGEAAALDAREVVCRDVKWRGPAAVPVLVQTRYRQIAVGAQARVDGSQLRITFDEPVRAVAPGQAAVCYTGNVVVGGGVVREAR